MLMKLIMEMIHFPVKVKDRYIHLQPHGAHSTIYTPAIQPAAPGQSYRSGDLRSTSHPHRTAMTMITPPYAAETRPKEGKPCKAGKIPYETRRMPPTIPNQERLRFPQPQPNHIPSADFGKPPPAGTIPCLAQYPSPSLFFCFFCLFCSLGAAIGLYRIRGKARSRDQRHRQHFVRS